MVNIGIIGLGRMGGYHASIASQMAGVKLVGVADPLVAAQEKIKNDTVIKSKDYKEWIEFVDGVIISVPTEYHFSIAYDCLKRGKHVLLEKPLTKTIKEAEELFELAEKKGCALHVGHVERFNGAVQELRSIIKEPFLIESHRMGPFASRVQKDSVVLDLMIHDLDIILNLINSPVTSVGALGKKIYSSSCDAATVQLGFANGVAAHIVSSRASQIKQRTMTINQKDEYINLDFTTQDISIHRHATSSVQIGHDQLRYKQETKVEHLFVHKENPLKLEINYFVNAIRDKKYLCNPEQDIAALKITIEIEKILGLR